MRKVQRVARLQVLFDKGPYCALRRIGHEHLYDGAALHRFFDREKRFSRDPAVALRAVPVLLVFLRLADDNVDAVVLHVERLGRPLHAVADDGDDFLLEDAARLCKREFLPGDDRFLYPAEIDDCHELFLLCI